MTLAWWLGEGREEEGFQPLTVVTVPQHPTKHNLSSAFSELSFLINHPTTSSANYISLFDLQSSILNPQVTKAVNLVSP